MEQAGHATNIGYQVSYAGHGHVACLRHQSRERMTQEVDAAKAMLDRNFKRSLQRFWVSTRAAPLHIR